MSKHNVISIDLAKNVFQVCGFTKNNQVTFNKKITRPEISLFIAQQEPTLIAMEACYSSHYWARLFESYGHSVKLLPAQHVTPFVRGNKSDRNDAVAIAEAAQRPNIIPVPIKSIEQQDIQSLHRMRERYVSHRTGLINQTRGLLAEYGIVSAKGHRAFCQLLRTASDPSNKLLSELVKTQLHYIADEFYSMCDRINDIQKTLGTIEKNNPCCQILSSIPGIGTINSTAIYSAIKQGQQFKSAREFAVWLGLTPKQSSSGNTFKSSGITKRGNRYLRKQLVHGARSAVSRSRDKQDSMSLWINKLIARRGIQKAYVAYAARMARLAWILLQRNEMYKSM